MSSIGWIKAWNSLVSFQQVFRNVSWVIPADFLQKNPRIYDFRPSFAVDCFNSFLTEYFHFFFMISSTLTRYPVREALKMFTRLYIFFRFFIKGDRVLWIIQLSFLSSLYLKILTFVSMSSFILRLSLAYSLGYISSAKMELFLACSIVVCSSLEL